MPRSVGAQSSFAVALVESAGWAQSQPRVPRGARVRPRRSGPEARPPSRWYQRREDHPEDRRDGERDETPNEQIEATVPGGDPDEPGANDPCHEEQRRRQRIEQLGHGRSLSDSLRGSSDYRDPLVKAQRRFDLE